MNTKLTFFVVGLLALAALEFGLLGASAAGIVGGASHPLPPIPQRGNVADTPTATWTPILVATATATPPPGPNPGCAISPPTSSPPCSALAASIELARPDPSAISCDGISSSVLRVLVRNSKGDPVDDGTPVFFAVFNGSPSPYYALTSGGGASTSIVIYSDAYSQRPNVEVRAGDMETAIRVRCIPNSGCPLSPPPGTSPPCEYPTPTPFPCNPSPGADVNSPPCAVITPISPPICKPNQTSPPCTPLSPPSCDSTVPLSPPCAPPPTPPPSTTGVGGEIYIGTPELIGGKIRVPVNTTAAQDAFSGFNVDLRFDQDLAQVLSPSVDAAVGPIFDSFGGGSFCVRNPGTGSIVLGCTLLGNAADGVSGAGTLAFISLTPKASSGCLGLHLFTYGPPDGGGATDGTFTMNTRFSPAVQSNTYGPDVYVNVADGSDCSSVASWCTFDPSGCEAATPTPPGADAQTATAIAGPPDAATNTATGTPTATSTPAPTNTPVPTVTDTPVPPTSTPAPRTSPTHAATATWTRDAGRHTPFVTATVERTSTPAPSVRCADVTGDGRVTGRDVAAIAAHIIGRYRAAYDLNGDHRVNMQDVRIAIAQLGRRC